MFLKDLDEQSQKRLFLELAALIMMAEGNEDNIFLNIDYSDISYPFCQNIDKNEEEFLKKTCKELREKYFISTFPSSRSRNNHPDQPVPESVVFKASGTEVENYELLNILQKKSYLVLEEYSKSEEFKKEILEKIISSGEDIFNIKPEAIQKFMLSNLVIKQDILKRTAYELITINRGELDHFNNKVKKDMVFKIIGAGYSSGYFSDDKKTLFLYICELLNIESECVREFLHITEKLFTIKKELIDLINE